jgi:hypothetical protein
MGLLADPAALDVGELRGLLEASYRYLLAAAGVSTRA